MKIKSAFICVYLRFPLKKQSQLPAFGRKFEILSSKSETLIKEIVQNKANSLTHEIAAALRASQ